MTGVALKMRLQLFISSWLCHKVHVAVSVNRLKETLKNIQRKGPT